MSDSIKRYTGKDIDVTFDTKRCIHAEECVKGLSSVFNVKERPWIQPDNDSADKIAEVIHKCPSGALHFERHDDGAEETTPAQNIIDPQHDGPLYVRGNLVIKNGDDEVILEDTRVALCRCGASKNKPFCDNTHKNMSWTAPEGLSDAAASEEGQSLEEEDGQLAISAYTDGPYGFHGPFTIVQVSGEAFSEEEGYFCRCGQSGKKPFCDNTHRKIGFKAK